MPADMKMSLGVVLLLLSSALALALSPTAANAKNCLKVDDENSPAATVSGRITTHHKVPKGTELRAAEGFFLQLDTPLLVDNGGGCYERRKIAVRSPSCQRIGRWTNQHVTIEGKLDRFGSALVDPPIFITITTIRKD